MQSSRPKEGGQGKVGKYQGFWMVPKGAMHLSPIAQLVLGIFFTYANGENRVWPGQQRIAEALGVGKRSVQRALDELEKDGAIERQRRGLGKTNVYFLSGQIGASVGVAKLAHPIGIDEMDKKITHSEQGSPQVGTTEKPPRPKTDLVRLLEHFFAIKGWPIEGPAFRRYLRAGKELLQACEGNVELAMAKLDKVKVWADTKVLDWSVETVLKRWNELDVATATAPKKPYIDGDPAYKDKRGDWHVILRDGRHVKWNGPSSAVKYV